MRFPEIGRVSLLERLLGWRDIRCEGCGRVVGVGRPAGGSRVISCADCRTSLEEAVRVVAGADVRSILYRESDGV